LHAHPTATRSFAAAPALARELDQLPRVPDEQVVAKLSTGQDPAGAPYDLHVFPWTERDPTVATGWRVVVPVAFLRPASRGAPRLRSADPPRRPGPRCAPGRRPGRAGPRRITGSWPPRPTPSGWPRAWQPSIPSWPASRSARSGGSRRPGPPRPGCGGIMSITGTRREPAP